MFLSLYEGNRVVPPAAMAEKAEESIAAVSWVLNYEETLKVIDKTRQRIFKITNKLVKEKKDKKRRKNKLKIRVYYSYSLEEKLPNLDGIIFPGMQGQDMVDTNVGSI